MGAGPAYRVVTPRLVLRCWDPADAPQLKEAIEESVEALRPWMTWVAQEPEGLQEKIDRLRHRRAQFDLGQDFSYGIFEPDGARVLGATGFHPRVGPAAIEIGYWIRRTSHNQGLATEAASALCRIAFEIERLARVEIHCDPTNLRSAAIPRKLGFRHEATLRGRIPSVQGPLRDAMIWSLVAEEYPTSPAASVPVQAFDAAGRRIL